MRDDFDCPVEDCDNCEFNRSQSWCAEHYKWMEDHWEQLDAYTGLIIRILEECYNEKRIPTEADMFMIDNFWEDKET